MSHIGLFLLTHLTYMTHFDYPLTILISCK